MHSIIRLIRKARISRKPIGVYTQIDPKKRISKATILITAAVPLAASFISGKRIDDDNNAVDSVYGAFRFFRSLSVGIWISIDYYFSMLGLSETNSNYNFMMSRIHERSANHILNACMHNGGPYIKLGQGLVAMSHILPKEYISTLKVLQDKCLIRGDGELNILFQEDFGKSPSEMYYRFQRVPIAAASLAQVYRAETFNKEVVAVKVQYIDLRKRFLTDVKTVKFLLRVASWMHPDYNFSWILDDLKETLHQELDFINEGKNSEQCAKDLAHLKYVYVPKVFWDLSSDRVLVTEFTDGVKISEVDELKKQGFSLTDINNKMFEAFGHQIFQSGFVHADPHSGNILVRKKSGSAELVLLDHGLYQQISESERKALSHMWKAMVLSNHSEMQKYSNVLGVQDYEIFAEILAQAPLKKNKFQLKSRLTEEDMKIITEFARTRFDTIMSCLKTMPPSLLLVLRNLNTIRGICHDHGNPIDRYSVLARVAIKSTYERNGVLLKLVSIPKHTYFEIRILTNKLTRWIRNLTMKILVNLGFAPDIKKLMEEVM